MVDSIVKTLGVGSGIDIPSLVNSLVDSQFAAKTGSINRQSSAISAQISAVAALKSGISDFSSALTTLAKSGSLATAPTSSNSAIVKTSALPGAKLTGFSATIEVQALASAQSAATAPVADRTAPIGTGTLTVTLGTATVAGGAITGFTPGAATPVDIVIDAANSSLDQIAAAINAANAGVTASIITDAGGARLALKGKTGEAQAFTLTATEDPGSPGLAALNVAPGAAGTVIGTVTQDAVVVLDGIPLKRPANSISDLIDGVKLDLVDAKPGTVVTLGNTLPTEELRSAVNDFVSAFNDLQALIKQQTNATTGPLFGDPAARALQRALSSLPLTTLVTGGVAGAPTSLSELSVSTGRDGRLSVNAAALTAALTRFPDAVEKIFADGTGASGGGLAAALAAITTQATDLTLGLGASEDRYTKQQTRLSEASEKAVAEAEQVRTRLTRQFSGADARIAAYKSTQAFLTQQIASWNKSGQ